MESFFFGISFFLFCHLLVCCLADLYPQRTLHHGCREMQRRLVFAEGGAHFDVDKVLWNIRARGYEEARDVLFLPWNLR